MPNWCEGVLKIRGEKNKLLEFLTKGLSPLSSTAEKSPQKLTSMAI